MTGKKYYGYQQIFEIDQKRKQPDRLEPLDHQNINDLDQKDQKDQKIDKTQALSLENISSLEKSDNSGWKISSQEDIASLENISRQENISIQQQSILEGIKLVKGSSSIPNTLLDSLGELLTTAEQLVFIHLYRLSYGFNKSQCLISLDRLGQRTGMSGRNIQNVVKNLERKGLIKKVGHNIGAGKLQGIIFQIEDIARMENNSRLEKFSSQENISSQEVISTNKDHDDDLKKQDHHQSEHEKSVMMIYQNVTGNSWTKPDIAVYQKIKHIPVEVVETAIRLATQRATNRPNSLAYFIKEILSVASPKTNHSKQKKLMEKIVDRVRNSLTGSNYSISDFVFKVKELCLRDNIAFDNDLLDEILDRKNRYPRN